MSPDPAQAAAWLSRNAVDCLPEGALARKLELGRPLRVKLGIDPTAPDIHLGFTVVLQKLREFQDAGPHGRPDHRRLHGSRGRSERPLGDASGAQRRGDRRQRGKLPGTGAEGARPRPARGPLQRRVARHDDGGHVPAAVDDHRRARDRARRLRQAPRRGDAGVDARAAVSRCCRVTTRSRSGPTSSSAAPTRSSTCCSGATSSAPTACRSR